MAVTVPREPVESARILTGFSEGLLCPFHRLRKELVGLSVTARVPMNSIVQSMLLDLGSQRQRPNRL